MLIGHSMLTTTQCQCLTELCIICMFRCDGWPVQLLQSRNPGSISDDLRGNSWHHHEECWSAQLSHYLWSRLRIQLLWLQGAFFHLQSST